MCCAFVCAALSLSMHTQCMSGLSRAELEQAQQGSCATYAAISFRPRSTSLGLLGVVRDGCHVLADSTSWFFQHERFPCDSSRRWHCASQPRGSSALRPSRRTARQLGEVPRGVLWPEVAAIGGALPSVLAASPRTQAGTEPSIHTAHSWLLPRLPPSSGNGGESPGPPKYMTCASEYGEKRHRHTQTHTHTQRRFQKYL